MENASVKSEAHRLVDELPDKATWDDLMYRIYVRQAIKAGLEDSRAGRVIPEEEV
jgi:predicted transcriptional regulator